ncbi:unnamed protein product [Adineta ricciae]|uniref:Uncharacterized protein n=1 Tax=Adineta ricciae TaxID=249248 RepID=A0A813PPC2_ADIRI|nr:unnamed protein product [Adineta ricciae]
MCGKPPFKNPIKTIDLLLSKTRFEHQPNLYKKKQNDKQFANAGIAAYLVCIANCSVALPPLGLGGCEILCLPLLSAPTP